MSEERTTYTRQAIPFTTYGNRRGLTDDQLADDQSLRDFVDRFPDSFEYDPGMAFHFLKEPKL